MKAIILAAGQGKRLVPYSKDKPKCLLLVGDNTTLIGHQLKMLRCINIKDAVIVVGYKKEKVKKHLKKNYPDFRFVLIDNPEFATTNTVYSLWLARDCMNEDFFYLNADVLFHPKVLEDLKKSTRGNVLAVQRGACGKEEVKVILNSHRIVHIGKGISQKRAFGEFIGIAKFSCLIASDFIKALEKVMDEKGKNEYFEDALDIIASRTILYALDITDLPSIEVDFSDDLKKARDVVYPQIVRLKTK